MDRKRERCRPGRCGRIRAKGSRRQGERVRRRRLRRGAGSPARSCVSGEESAWSGVDRRRFRGGPRRRALLGRRGARQEVPPPGGQLLRRSRSHRGGTGLRPGRGRDFEDPRGSEGVEGLRIWQGEVPGGSRREGGRGGRRSRRGSRRGADRRSGRVLPCVWRGAQLGHRLEGGPCRIQGETGARDGELREPSGGRQAVL